MERLGTVDPEDDSGLLPRLAPSPHSEAVAHEFQELSLQPIQCLPPLNERKNVLQLRLQQRRTREQLVDQGIMPPLKSPAAFHEQIKSLERARTENFLKHKIRSRPDRSELVRMHILEETFAEPSLQATQMKLKRARLADDLNEKIAQRPGPMELVEKNILPVDSSVKEAIIAVGELKESYPQALEDFLFDDDSSDALSPDQPASQESQGSAASPGEPKVMEAPSPVTPASSTNQCPPLASSVSEFLKPSVTNQHTTRPTTAAPLTTNAVSSVKLCSGPALVKQPHPKNPSDKPRNKKCKDPKPRVKKLKYHQYIPPDQKGEKNEPQMDSNYARLLQQQQLFLQLQILSQQQQHYNYQTILPAPLKPVSDSQSTSGNAPLTSLNNSTAATNMQRQNNTISNRKPGPLPPSLDDLKVAELKMELKLRGLPVSGTKMDLIERLKPYQDLNNNSISTSNAPNTTTSANSISNPGEVAAIFPASTLNKPAATSVPCFSSETSSVGTSSKSTYMECLNSPLPISPSPSEQSNLSTDDANMADTLTEIMTLMSPPQLPNTSPTNEDRHLSGSTPCTELAAAEKDRRLKEKEKQIEELKKKLEQEQKLVEVLKMQLEVEKRGHQQPSQAPTSLAPILNQKHAGPVIKEEGALADCSDGRRSLSEASPSLGQPTLVGVQNLIAKKALVIKQEVPLAKAEPQNIISQFYVSSQRQPQTAMVAQPQTLLTAQGTAQLLLPLSLQGPNPAASVQLPVGNVQVQAQPQPGIPSVAQISASSSLVQKMPQMHTSPPKPNSPPQHVLGQTSQNRKVFSSTSPNAVFSYQNQSLATLQQPLFNQASSAAVHSGSQVPLVQNGPSTPQKPASPSEPQQYGGQQPLFSPSVTKAKDPPRYEEAIKQTRSAQASQREISSAHSQQMDDLFDILIKSGEISLPTKEESSLISKMRPVTASITTMPVNTVVSRPPPQVQMAPPLSIESISNFSVCLENQLEALLEGTLPSGNEMPPMTNSNEDRESFSLIEDLQNDLLNHSGILDHSQSPMETSDSQFTTTGSCLSLDLPDTNLDNMEWLDITMPNTSSGLTPLSATAPSMFSADFLDAQDLQLHWD
ncbi:myocardin-related transcription factor B [Eublepharis macularius]|uniref:Myocardin-related transcription factor B n=1 Tax=Eublepharis macularius TaxID=481883 RepID=A0AA97K6K7_EUBMA|nr:myocardin-related transcription factor B [Eublepharis macularius]